MRRISNGACLSWKWFSSKSYFRFFPRTTFTPCTIYWHWKARMSEDDNNLTLFYYYVSYYSQKVILHCNFTHWIQHWTSINTLCHQRLHRPNACHSALRSQVHGDRTPLFWQFFFLIWSIFPSSAVNNINLLSSECG